jgi:septal ring factor EnvC (AmiA/AmiB activator)
MTTHSPATAATARPRRKRLVLAGVVMIAAALACGARATAVLGQSGGVSTDVEIAGLLDEIEASTAKQERVDREAGDLKTQREQTRRDLRGQIRALYRITRGRYVPLSGGVDAVLRHVARVKRLRQVVQQQAVRLGSYDDRAQSLRVKSGQIAEALQNARARLTLLQSTPSAARARPELALDGASEMRAEYNSGGYGLRLVDPAPASTFESERGSLSSPVTGDVRIASARRAESDGPGLEFQAPAGTAVRAVAAGRVAFSDRYGSYGRLVILDHGGGFYTVYGGLGSVEVRVGDDLSRQARIGSIGGDSATPALFFEVRKGTRTLEPRGWLGL